MARSQRVVNRHGDGHQRGGARLFHGEGFFVLVRPGGQGGGIDQGASLSFDADRFRLAGHRQGFGREVDLDAITVGRLLPLFQGRGVVDGEGLTGGQQRVAVRISGIEVSSEFGLRGGKKARPGGEIIPEAWPAASGAAAAQRSPELERSPGGEPVNRPGRARSGAVAAARASLGLAEGRRRTSSTAAGMDDWGRCMAVRRADGSRVWGARCCRTLHKAWPRARRAPRKTV